MARAPNAPGSIRPPSVKETLRRHIGDASRALRAPALDDEAVHRARKELKRARASLRLLRPALGKRVYARENAALRDAARALSAVRDARVIVDTLDKLVTTEKNSNRRALLVKLRGTLEQSRAAAWRELQANGTAASSAEMLDRVWRRVERRQVPGNGASLMREGVERIYRKGRQALGAVRADCTPEALHEWRKQVKYLGHAMLALGAEQARPVEKMMKRLEALADALGDDRDLIVLEQHVTQLHAQSHARTGVSREITVRRRMLQSKALEQGRGLYKANPRAFARRVRTADLKQ